MDGELQAEERKLRTPPPFGGDLLIPTNPERASKNGQLAWVLLAFAVAVTIVLAILASNESTLVSAVLALVAGIFQVGSVIVGMQSGRADKNLVRHLARRLQTLGVRMNSAVNLAETAFKDCPLGSSLQSHVGRLSVELDITRQACGELLETWRDLNPELFAVANGQGGVRDDRSDRG
jgi:hypothetical protein